MNVAFARFRRQMARLTGVVVDGARERCVESRLRPLMRAHGLNDFFDLTRLMEHPMNTTIVADVIDAMTTNETSFFRDRAPFDEFRNNFLPRLMAARDHEHRLRIWCAACSTGQEAYSLAMALDQEARALRGWTVDILATDVSRAAIQAARAGVYSQFEVQRGLSTTDLLRYFTRQDESWRVNEHIRARIVFREFNLMSDFAALGKFDVVFCRNVLLYFDPETKRSVLSRIGSVLESDGYLFLGATENLGDAASGFSKASSDGVWSPRERERVALRLA